MLGKEEVISGKMNNIILDTLDKYPYVKIKCNIHQYLKSKGLRIQDLSLLTGIRTATLSEMINMKRTTLNVHHILVIAIALKITDLSELFTLEMDEETYETFEKERPLGVTKDMEEKMEETKIYFEERAEQNKRKRELQENPTGN